MRESGEDLGFNGSVRNFIITCGDDSVEGEAEIFPLIGDYSGSNSGL